MDWLRLYTEITRDRKLRRHDPAIRWVWVTMLVIARSSPRPGYLLIGDDVSADIADIADEAAVDEADVERALGVFAAQNMIEERDGTYYILNWDSRQFSSDNSTERSRKSRSKRCRNNDATLQQRCEDVSATPPDTDTDTDTEIKTPPLPPPGGDPASTPVPPPFSVSGRPYVSQFVAEVWRPCFSRSPDLLPSTYSVDAEKLDRLERAIAPFARLPDGVDGLFRELVHRIGPEGESTITGLRMTLQERCSRRNRRWQQSVIPYLAGVIDGIREEFERENGNTDSSGRRNAGGASGPHRRDYSGRQTGRVYPRSPANWDGVKGGVQGFDDGAGAGIAHHG